MNNEPIFEEFSGAVRDEAHTTLHSNIPYKAYDLVCAECFETAGTFTYSENTYVSCRSMELGMDTTKKLVRGSYSSINRIYSIECHCKECERITEHFVADCGTGRLLQKLTQKGFTPLQSCAGHVKESEIDIGYVLLAGDMRRHFPQLHPLLKYIDVKYFEDDGSCKTGLYVSASAPIEYAYGLQWIEDLMKYLESEIDGIEKDSGNSL